MPNNMFADSGEYCPESDEITKITIRLNNDPTNTVSNCCPVNNFIKYNNNVGVCCKETKLTSEENSLFAATSDAYLPQDNEQPTHNTDICGPTNASTAIPAFSTRERDYFCVGEALDYGKDDNGQDYIQCVNGYFVAVSTYNPNTPTSQGHHYTPTERNNNHDYDENIQNFYYLRNAVTYNNTTPVIDCAKQIIEDTTQATSGTIWHNWKAATKKDNTCNYTNLGETSQSAPNIWNISMPLLGKEIETQ
jgi:hypothetical protein